MLTALTLGPLASDVARTLVSAAPALVPTLADWRQSDKRRDESRRGRHECPRHIGVQNAELLLRRSLARTSLGTITHSAKSRSIESVRPYKENGGQKNGNFGLALAHGRSA